MAKRAPKVEMNMVPPPTLAAELNAIEQDMAMLEKRAALIKEQLMSTLKYQGVRQVPLENGTVYIRAERKTLQVKDNDRARAWAEENHALTIDKSKVLKIFQLSRKRLPPFFGTKVTEYLTIRRPKEDGQEMEQE